MAARVVPVNNTILQVLDLYNYADWSRRVETYLIAEGLWDVVESTATTPNDETEHWKMKNAKALLAIQNSCRTDVFGFIREIRIAKDAWETLAKRLKPKNTDIDGMAATLVPSVMINLKALNQDYYKHWSFWVKTYLMAEDLWDVVQGTSEPPKLEDGEGEAEYMAWQKSNARALHVITIFCGEDAESSISDIERAKDAWNTLANKFDPPQVFGTPEENLEDDSNDDTGSNDELKVEVIGANEDRTSYGPFFLDVFAERWQEVKEFINHHPEAVRAKSRYSDWTALHLAALFGSLVGVKELLPFLEKKDLEVLDDEGRTALSLALQNLETDDAVEIIKCIVEKDKKLLRRVVDLNSNNIPLLYALSSDKPKMAGYLYSVTPLGKLKSKDVAELVSTGLRLKRLDIPLDLLRRFPNVAIAKDHSGESPINELASTRSGLFLNASQLGIWERWIYSCINPAPRTCTPTGDVSINVPEEEKDQGNRKHLICKVTCFFGGLVAKLRELSGIEGIHQMKLIHEQTIEILDRMCMVLKQDNLNYMQRKFVEKALFQAVERGNTPFIKRFLRESKENRCWLLAITNEHDKNIFQFAAEHRQDKVFELISWGAKERKEIVGKPDKFGNNMLHVVGKLPPLTKIAHIRGAALQMQNELQWFKMVERMSSPKDLNCINSEGRTPHEEFTVNHRDLVKEGELSMKETATSSSALVGALIITIMFAAAVTVPGGIKGDTGIPIHLDAKAFRIFIVADVISLCSATTSVMIFLGILTSRYAEEDFLTSLPTKLIIGFFTLFLSVGTMMISFSSAIFIMLPEKPSIVIPSIVLAGVPIASFLWMQLPFLLEIIIATYGSRAGEIYRRLEPWAWRLKTWAWRLKRLVRRIYQRLW